MALVTLYQRRQQQSLPPPNGPSSPHHNSLDREAGTVTSHRGLSADLAECPLPGSAHLGSATAPPPRRGAHPEPRTPAPIPRGLGPTRSRSGLFLGSTIGRRISALAQPLSPVLGDGGPVAPPSRLGLSLPAAPGVLLPVVIPFPSPPLSRSFSGALAAPSPLPLPPGRLRYPRALSERATSRARGSGSTDLSPRKPGGGACRQGNLGAGCLSHGQATR
ncbi:hypothetical protein chiPu_0015182 [Chiloscyllium punctatum]|uniref:Uncharacterized protein n=1 Tax=Chiloscyllium punctatum TaxID=137246 RepID=A0A401T218_CHIPU|nr:hypothetical protein [Chiloscyllium punctatum]